MTRIDIDRFSEEEVIDLNHKIVSRLRFLREMRSHREMMNFRIGEKVSFHPSGHPVLTGTITRYNKKSVTVIADNGQRWNVHPGFLSKAPSTPDQSTGSNSQKDNPVLLFPPSARTKT